MLTVTENARQAIQALMANAELPEGSGLRFDAPDEPPGPSVREAPLQLQVASGPSEQDQVIDEGEVRVFISPRVAPALDGKVLDARVSDDRVQFTIGPPDDQQAEEDQQGEPG